MARTEKSRHCYHLVILKTAVWCSFLRQRAGAVLDDSHSRDIVQIMFLICSYGVLSSLHEPSILHALKHPPVDGALRAGGCDFSFPEIAVAIDVQRRRGRGAQSNATGRFEAEARVAFDDGWQSLEELPPFKTTVALDTARKVITRNDSPDIGFDRSINPYRGCEHGCVYCFARPTHAFLGLSPGLDFESKLFAKPDAPELLEKELAAPGYEPRTIAIGTNTDPVSADRARTQDHARHSRSAGARRPSRSASSPNRRW